MIVSEAVMAVLSAAETEGNCLRLTGSLDRKLYVETDKVLQAAGGKWNRGAKAHVFEGSAAEAVDPILLTGQIARPQDFGFFETPDPVLDEMLARVKLMPSHRLLEPSAGRGRIVNRVLGLVDRVDAYEILPDNAAALRRIDGVHVHECDFLGVDPVPIYDVVMMNPPFARQADITHVLHAAKFLHPGGRLVAIMAAGVTFREDRRAREFRGIVEARGGTITRLPGGSFRSSGTDVSTVVVAFDDRRSA